MQRNSAAGFEFAEQDYRELLPWPEPALIPNRGLLLRGKADAVANGLEAVRALEAVPYDLLFVDVQMPEMDGYQATRRIREPGSNVGDPMVPIVAMTSHVMKGDREKSLEAGMDDYVSKPVRPDDLIQVIKRRLAVKRTNTEGDFDGPAGHDNVVLDQSVLDELLGEDQELKDSILDGFLADSSDQLRELIELGLEGDAEGMSRIAHSLKSAAGSVGAISMQTLAGKIEQNAFDGQTDSAALISGLQQEFEKLKTKLKTS